MQRMRKVCGIAVGRAREGSGLIPYFSLILGIYFFQRLWSETSNEFGMDFWTIMHILTVILLLKMRFESFDEFRALFKRQGK